jgi:hypothetical protein
MHFQLGGIERHLTSHLTTQWRTPQSSNRRVRRTVTVSPASLAITRRRADLTGNM